MKFIWIVVFLVIEVVALLFFNYQRDREVQKYISSLYIELDANYRAFLRQYQKISEVFYDDLSNKADTLALMNYMCSQDLCTDGCEDTLLEKRKEFIGDITPTVLLAQSMGFSQIHFQYADNRSFYRSKSPERFGDKLSDFRHSVSAANSTKKPVYGLEEGRVINGFRYVYPLFLDGEHIGAVDFSVSTKMMQRELEDLYSGSFWIILEENIIKNIVFDELLDKTYAKSPFGEGFLIEKDMEDTDKLDFISKHIGLKKGVDFFAFEHFYGRSSSEEGEFVIVFMPLKNIAKDDLGYLVYAKKDSTLSDIDDSFLAYTLLFTLFWGSVLIFWYLLKRKHIFLLIENQGRKEAEIKLKELNVKLEEILKDETRIRKEKESLIYTIFEKAPMGMVISDNNRNFIDVNPFFCKMIGYTKDELLSMKIGDIAEGVDEARNVELIEGLKDGRFDFIQTEKHYKRKDGSMMLSRLTGTLIKGQERYVLAIIEDITQKRELEIKQKSQEQMLVQQSKMAAMGEMIGAIAHQWRQPLSVLALVVQNIEDAYVSGGFSEEFLHDSVIKSMVQIEYMSKTIDDFRNFYKPKKEQEEFDVLDSFARVKALIKAQLDHNEIEVYIDKRCENTHVVGHKNEFEQSILNLLTNSKDAILEKRAEHPKDHFIGAIQVIVDRVDNGLYIEIGDNGSGIAKEARERLFEPYFTTKEGSKGTGIGLYMSKMMIENGMGGTIYFKENVKEGAVAVINIPENNGELIG